MNAATSLRYHLYEYRTAIPIFYSIVIILLLLSAILSGENSHVSGLEYSTGWFLCISAMNSFRGHFLFHLQLGSTRRTLFKGWLLFCAILSLLVTATNVLLVLAAHLFVPSFSSPLFAIQIESAPLRILAGGFSSLCSNLLAMALGYLVTCGFYRLNKIGKWVVGLLIGGAVLLCINLTIQFESIVTAVLETMFTFPYVHPFFAGGIYLLAAAILLMLCWAIIHNIPEKNRA